jgi:hypothetical protein
MIEPRSSDVVNTAPFTHLRRASPETLAAIYRLRAGEMLPIDTHYAEALGLWSIERGIAFAWAKDVRMGKRRERCPEINAWAEVTRRRFNVQTAWEGTR